MTTDERNQSGGRSSCQLLLKLRHPNCWMSDVTVETDGRLLVNAVYTVDGHVKTHVIVHANTIDAVDALVAATRESDHTYSVNELHPQSEFQTAAMLVGKATRGLLVEYDPTKSIHNEIVTSGFLPQEPLRIRNGYEFWTVAADKPRNQLQANLDAIAREYDAEITIQRISTRERAGRSHLSGDLRSLSDRQREVFELARGRGYYEWPREVSATDLADDLGVSKSTVLEHLRKAEATLLGPQ